MQLKTIKCCYVTVMNKRMHKMYKQCQIVREHKMRKIYSKQPGKLHVKYSLSYLGLFLCHFMLMTWADACVPELLIPELPSTCQGFSDQCSRSTSSDAAPAAVGGGVWGSCERISISSPCQPHLGQFLEGGQLISEPEGPQGPSSSWKFL